MNIAYVLILIYSPVSPYFHGLDFEQKQDRAACLAEASARIGEELRTGIAWEREMMGPVPKVIAAFCAEGIAP
jgi:hypothetical protein